MSIKTRYSVGKSSTPLIRVGGGGGLIISGIFNWWDYRPSFSMLFTFWESTSNRFVVENNVIRVCLAWSEF